jgi:voltage-gated potassium channel
MGRQILFSALLVVTCLFVHLVAIGFLVRKVVKIHIWTQTMSHPLWVMRWLTRIFLILMTSHFLQVTVWAAFYRLSDSFATLEESVYFSMVSYTTLGYGDLILPPHWRLLGGVEAMTGVILLGWSAAFTFLVLNQISEARAKGRSGR